MAAPAGRGSMGSPQRKAELAVRLRADRRGNKTVGVVAAEATEWLGPVAGRLEAAGVGIAMTRQAACREPHQDEVRSA